MQMQSAVVTQVACRNAYMYECLVVPIPWHSSLLDARRKLTARCVHAVPTNSQGLGRGHYLPWPSRYPLRPARKHPTSSPPETVEPSLAGVREQRPGPISAPLAGSRDRTR